MPERRSGHHEAAHMLASKRPEGRESYRPHVCLRLSVRGGVSSLGRRGVAGFAAQENQIRIPDANIPSKQIETFFEKRLS